MIRIFFFFSSRRRHTRWPRDWSSDVCSSDLDAAATRLGPQLPPLVVHDRARELRELGEASERASRERRRGQLADGVVSGRGAGKLAVLTEDYLSIYLPIAVWNGRPRFDFTVP